MLIYMRLATRNMGFDELIILTMFLNGLPEEYGDNKRLPIQQYHARERLDPVKIATERVS